MNSSGLSNVLTSLLIVGVLGFVIYCQQEIPAVPSVPEIVATPSAPSVPQVVEVAPGKVVENPVPQAAVWESTEGLQDARAMQENLAQSVGSAEEERQQLLEKEKAKFPDSSEPAIQPETAPDKKVIAVTNPFQPAPSNSYSWAQQIYRGNKAIQSKHTQQLPECEDDPRSFNRAPASVGSTLPPIHLEPIGENHHEKIHAYNDPERYRVAVPRNYQGRSKCEQAILDNLNGKK